MKLTDLITPDDFRAALNTPTRGTLKPAEFFALYEPYLLAIVDVAIELGLDADAAGQMTIGFHLVDAAIQHATARSNTQ